MHRVKVRDGVFLRPMEAHDAVRILEIIEADPTIRQRVSIASRLHTVKDVRQEVTLSESDGGVVRYVVVSGGVVVGLISLWRDSGYFGHQANPNAYGFGYFLDPTVRGRGLVSDGITCLMDELVKNIPVELFLAFCEDDNRGSVGVLTRLGFVPTDQTYSEPHTGWTERRYERTLNGK